MAKRVFIILVLGISVFGFGQNPQIHDYAKMAPAHILDEKLNDISFALSMRVVESDYNGPLVRLRRAGDNAEMDFGWADNDIVDVAAINTWRGAANVYLVIWYDQSGLGRNAVQPTAGYQPRFYPDALLPYFIGDAVDDRLDVMTSIQTLTNAGANGTVLIIAVPGTGNDFTFGSLNGTNRWSGHINWGNDNLYFDPGGCCTYIPRNFDNTSNIGEWSQYTMVRGTDFATVRNMETQKYSALFAGNCTLTNNFGILYSNGSNSNYAGAKIAEFFLFKTDIPSTVYQEIEQDQITFWNL